MYILKMQIYRPLRGTVLRSHTTVAGGRAYASHEKLTESPSVRFTLRSRLVADVKTGTAAQVTVNRITGVTSKIYGSQVTMHRGLSGVSD